MKPLVFHSALFVIIGCLLSAMQVANASPVLPDSVHFCAFYEYEQSRGDHPHPAAKLPANLDVGEPRTVRLILFMPSDRPYRVGLVDSIKTAIVQSQAFFGEQMQAHGYGYMTFQYETDTQGEPLVHLVNGQHPESHYFEKTPGVQHALWEREIEQVFDVEENVYVYFRDITRHTGSATGYRWTKKRGRANLPARAAEWGVLSHELSHAFGLGHDYRDGAYILSYGGPSNYPGGSTWNRISACAAEFYSVNPYFNSAVPIDEFSLPNINLISPTEYPGGSKSVSIRLEVSDAEGLHQVLLSGHPGWGYGGIRECQTLSGQRKVLVEFEYDGSSMFADPQRAITSLSDSLHRVEVQAVDTDGNMSELKFDLVPDRVPDALKGHTDSVNAVAFSSDGATLASGSSDGTVRLWDVARRELLGILRGHSFPVMAVAFSNDGTLVSGSSYDIKLWDMTTRNEIATLVGIAPVAFSPDGTLLASGSGNNMIALWDARSRKKIATLEGHAGQINTVAFSPDGSMLASGSGHNGSGEQTVRLWDVASRNEIASIEHAGTVRTVVFSPIGRILASAAGPPANAVRLWDVRSRREVARLWPRGPFLSLAYSPGGELLASGSGDGKIRLWDALSRELIGTFLAVQPRRPFDGGVRSLAYSPDGTVLAAGLRDHTIKLRDVSEWTGPRPAALEIISGNGQQGAPGDTLIQPMMIEVRDQFGAPLTNAEVTFTVTTGDGTLSVSRATTDEAGRAATTLTLGRQPGTNTVVATVSDIDPVTFTAIGRAHADFDGDGTVGFGDFLLFAAAFGRSQGDAGYNAQFDLDGNGAIGFSDFLIFAVAFGTSTA